MGFQPDPDRIQWRLRLRTSPEEVFRTLATGAGRAHFWAESAEEANGSIHFFFPNGYRWEGKILEEEPPTRFQLEYIGGSHVTFELAADGSGGTLLTLTDQGVDPAYRSEVTAGWVSVLLSLKAAVDFGVDLRNHDPDRCWDQGFVEN